MTIEDRLKHALGDLSFKVLVMDAQMVALTEENERLRAELAKLKPESESPPAAE